MLKLHLLWRYDTVKHTKSKEKKKKEKKGSDTKKFEAAALTRLTALNYLARQLDGRRTLSRAPAA
jgi:hypothetical protein